MWRERRRRLLVGGMGVWRWRDRRGGGCRESLVGWVGGGGVRGRGWGCGGVRVRGLGLEIRLRVVLHRGLDGYLVRRHSLILRIMSNNITMTSQARHEADVISHIY